MTWRFFSSVLFIQNVALTALYFRQQLKRVDMVVSDVVTWRQRVWLCCAEVSVTRWCRTCRPSSRRRPVAAPVVAAALERSTTAASAATDQSRTSMKSSAVRPSTCVAASLPRFSVSLVVLFIVNISALRGVLFPPTAFTRMLSRQPCFWFPIKLVLKLLHIPSHSLLLPLPLSYWVLTFRWK